MKAFTCSQTRTAFARHSPCASRPRNMMRRSQPLDAIDPSTGVAYADQDIRAPKAQLSVDADGMKWAYRKAEASGDKKTPVLLLHGIGSQSFCYRDLMRLLAESGHTCYAPDWPGHGASEKPSTGFAYDEDSYVRALESFTQAVGLEPPFHVVTHGFVLGQYGLLWALTRATDIEKLVILGAPLGKNTSLRPELSPYKAALGFMRPKADSKFAADLYNAGGLAYVIAYDDAQAYDMPYQEGDAANQALFKTMEQMDWKALLKRVDEGFCGWRVPSAVLYGNADPFLDVRDAMDFLETKRTSMKLASIEGKLGHMPQEDFSEGFSGVLLDFFDGADITVRGTKKFKKREYEERISFKGETGNFSD